MASLSPLQDQVLALIASGSTAAAAARQAGVHRHTIANWLKSQEFRQNLDWARTQKRKIYADEAEALAAECISDLRQLKRDPTASHSIRLRAIALLFKHAQTFLSIKENAVILPDHPQSLPAPTSAPEAAAPNQELDQNIENMSKNVQPDLPQRPPSGLALLAPREAQPRRLPELHRVPPHPDRSAMDSPEVPSPGP